MFSREVEQVLEAQILIQRVALKLDPQLTQVILDNVIQAEAVCELPSKTLLVCQLVIRKWDGRMRESGERIILYPENKFLTLERHNQSLWMLIRSLIL